MACLAGRSYNSVACLTQTQKLFCASVSPELPCSLCDTALHSTYLAFPVPRWPWTTHSQGLFDKPYLSRAHFQRSGNQPQCSWAPSKSIWVWFLIWVTPSPPPFKVHTPNDRVELSHLTFLLSFSWLWLCFFLCEKNFLLHPGPQPPTLDSSRISPPSWVSWKNHFQTSESLINHLIFIIWRLCFF